MNNKLIITVLFLLFSLFLVGCDRTSDDNSPYPYIDNEYLGVKRDKDFEYDDELAAEIEKLVLAVGRAQPKPEFKMLSVSDSMYERLVRVYNGHDSDPAKLRVINLTVKKYKDKAIAAYEPVYTDKPSQVSESNPITPTETYNPDKLYLERSDGKWEITEFFVML